MDPVSAIGLASAIISFIGFGAKLLHGAKEIRDSANDSLEKNESREVIAEAMKEATTRLKTPDPGQISPEQQKLCDLAVKCNDLSQRILELLNKIKPKRSKSFYVYRAAYHAWRKEDEIKVLEKSLGDCRNQLALGLTELASQHSAEYSKRILALVQQDSSKLEQLEAHMKQLKKGVEVQAIGDGAVKQLNHLLGIHDDVLNAIYQDRILRSLQFEEMHDRDDRVQDPYENTFKWVLEDENDLTVDGNPSTSFRHGDDCRKMKMQSRNKLLSWLSSPTSIFHLSGKLGSGKSTLMKFLSTHPRTRTELKKWAGDRTLVRANFFFWKPGSELQKSLEGLFRSLLCDILTACPDLIRDTLPEYWHLAEQSPWQIKTKFNIPSSTINSALKSVISDQRLYKGHRFCFFIDGLDEYEGGDGQDPTHLVTLLTNWVKESHGCLKLCVSSREHNVFMNAFSMDQRLRLHEMTLFDMKEYVAGLLQDIQTHILNVDTRSYLINTIPEKADGIFLWTILVVRTIRRKAEDGEPERNLIRLLDSLPQGLDGMFLRVLEDLDADNRRRMFQTLAMMRAAKTYEVSFSLLAFSFLDDYETNNEFSLQRNIPSDKTIEGAQRRLRGACGGLVEVKRPGSLDKIGISTWGTLEYTHRSVPDMFGEGELKSKMQASLDGFDAISAISHLIFAAVQFLGGPDVLEARRICLNLAQLRLKDGVECAPYPFLGRMAKWLESYSPCPNPGCKIRVLAGSTPSITGGYMTLAGSVVEPSGEYFHGSVLCQAAYLGCGGYVKWRLERALKAKHSPLERAILAQIVLDYQHTNLWACDYFFADGILTDSTAIGYVGVSFQHGLVQAGDLTIWQRFLVRAFLESVNPPTIGLDRIGQIIQKFLEHGASRDFYFTVEDRAEDSRSTSESTITFALEDTSVTLKPRYFKYMSVGWMQAPDGSWAADTHTFRDWIHAFSWENKNRLLELLGEEVTVADDGNTRVSKSED
ncbi:hypothetical protein ACHAPT_011245 [Fusarium lateritium]